MPSGLADVDNCTKSDDILINAQNCIEKVCKMSRLHASRGECRETQHSTALEIDVCPDSSDK